jgi:hypothetical protein
MDRGRKQITSSLLMVRPASFGFNAETAGSNAFQGLLLDHTPEEIRQRAMAEFDQFVDLLRQKGIRVVVVADTAAPEKPDAVFPNNWITLHGDGTVALYPMQAPNRRLERRQDIVDALRQDFEVKQVLDFSPYEQENRFLEGTGSLILDHENRLAYACLSPRTDLHLLQEFCDRFAFKPVAFHAYDHSGGQVYHTNVILCIGQGFAVLCTETIRNPQERERVVRTLTDTGHELIDITLDQLRQYAGNMLEVENQAGQRYLVMSEQAYHSLRPDQVAAIEKYAQILAPPIYTIEQIGGGSARCMMAEIFLPPKT